MPQTLLLLLVSLLASPAGAAPGAPETSGGWTRVDGPHRYTKRSIYDYMDGAAEVHLMYGFRSLAVWRYARGGGAARVKVEIFDMGSSAGAFGDFTHARDLEGETVNVGQDGHHQSGVLWFWKGSFLVCVSSRAKGVSSRDLDRLARAVAATIRDSGQRPDLVRSLPRDGLRERTVRYFRRPEALAYHYGEFPHARLLRLRGGAEATLADYRRKSGPAVLLVVRYPTNLRAKSAHRRLAAVVPLARNDRGTWSGVSRDGRLLRVVLEATTRAEVKALLQEPSPHNVSK